MRVIICLTLICVLLFGINIASAQEPNSALSPTLEALQFLEKINEMREELAATLLEHEGPVGKETFEQVCKPVGMELKRKASERAWHLKQISHKARNPAARVEQRDQAVYEVFRNDPSIDGLIKDEIVDSQDGTAIFKRISVRKACLACHGAEASRPAFIVENFPNDQAYDFKEGDLRGLYRVFIPDTAKLARTVRK